MDRRQSKRIPVNFEATLISEEKEFEGIIENMSKDGLEYFMTYIAKIPTSFAPSKSIKLSFHTPTGEVFNLNCELIWFLETAPEERLLGMRIIDPPPTYKEIVMRQN